MASPRASIAHLVRLACEDCRHADPAHGVCDFAGEELDLRTARDECPCALSIARGTRDAWRRQVRSGLRGKVHLDRDGAPACGKADAGLGMSNDGGSVTCEECWWALARRRA